MKKIIFVVLLLLLCMGCSSTDSVKIENTNIYALRFEYEGHSYIQFHSDRPADGMCVSGYVHDPDCWCMIEYD